MGTYWKRCPEAEPRTDGYKWGCACHGLGEKGTLVPVSGVLIEDTDGAAERIACLVNFTDYNGVRDGEACLAFGWQALAAAIREVGL